MKPTSLTLIIITLILSFSVCRVTAEPEQAVDNAEVSPAGEIQYTSTIFTVPDLSKQTARELSRAIAQIPGLISAKPDFQNSTVTVVFSSENGSSAELLQAFQTVTPATTIHQEATLDKPAVKTMCGACPSQSGCSSKK